MQARWGAPAGTLPPEHPAWALEAHYLALGLWNLTLALSPRRILLGGGVMQQADVFPLIRTEFERIGSRYIQRPEIIYGLGQYIQPPQLGGRAGVLGTLVLAAQALAARL
jgi:fructokinase